MAEALTGARASLGEHAPRIETLKIPTDKIREVIGTGGKVIREIVEKTGAKIDIQDDGTVKVADVNGAPFYVMAHVDGVVLDSSERAEVLPLDIRRAAGEHLIDVLADLHEVDIDAIGLGDLARREGYIERQVKRWTTQWEKSKTRDLPAIDEVAKRLAANLPVQVGVSIAHGDYRFGNLLVNTGTGRIAAVLDWGGINRLLGMTHIWSERSLKLVLDSNSIPPAANSARTRGRSSLSAGWATIIFGIFTAARSSPRFWWLWRL